MYIPQVRERVQLAGRSGVFLVMWVDHEQQEADLMPLHRASSVEEIVPFSELEAYSKYHRGRIVAFRQNAISE
jgi:hypothetical protein